MGRVPPIYEEAKEEEAIEVSKKEAKQEEAMEEAKDDALEKEQEPVDTSTTAAPQSHADVLLLLEIKSLKKENKELRILYALARMRRIEDFSAFMEEVHLDLDETHFAELLPRIKLEEKRILATEKFGEDLKRLNELALSKN